MKITMYYEDKNHPITIEVPDADCEVWIEDDYQRRLADAEDKTSIVRRTAQEIMDDDCNKPTFNSHQRETRRHVSLDALDPNGDTLPSSEDVEGTVCGGPYSELYAAIDKLEPQQKELIRQIFWEGMKQKDIAAKQGVSARAITGRMQRIYAALKKDLKNFS